MQPLDSHFHVVLNILCWEFRYKVDGTGIDLSKIFGGKPKYWSQEQKVVITDESMGASQLFGNVRSGCDTHEFPWSTLSSAIFT